MKKKILATVIAVAMAIGLVACGSTTKNSAESTTVVKTDDVTVDGNIGTASKVTSKTIDIENYPELADYVKEKTTGSLVYDIALKNKDGKAVQPNGKVNVTVDTEGIADKNSGYVVYYVDDKGGFEKVNVSASTAKTVTFETTHFSAYAVLAYSKEKFSDESFLKDSAAVKAAAEAEAVESAESAFTYTDKSGSIYTTQTVNVRDLPDTSGNTLTTVKAGTELILLGQCNETGWYKVEYATDKVGYVSNDYASTDKPQPAKQSTQSDNTASQQPSGNGGGESTASAPASSGASTTAEAVDAARAMGYDLDTLFTAEDGHQYGYYIESNWPSEPGYMHDEWLVGYGTSTTICMLGDYFQLRRIDIYAN